MKDMYVGIVESYRIKIEDFILFIIRNHSLKFASTSITTLVELGKTNTCFISSSSTWVINFGAIDYVTCNSSFFTTFKLHPSTSTITLADRSTYCVLRSEIIHPTPLITLTYVMSLSQFSFNLIFVSKFTHTLNYSISFFFPDYCLIQDLSTKWVIGRGRKSGGLYILETKRQRLLFVLESLPHSNYIVAWVILLSLC